MRFSRTAVRDAWASATGVRLATSRGVLEVPRVLVAAGAEAIELQDRTRHFHPADAAS